MRRVTALVFDVFVSLNAGKTATRYRTGRILKSILHGNHAAPAPLAIASEAATRLMGQL